MTLVWRFLYRVYRISSWLRYRAERRFTRAGMVVLGGLMVAATMGVDTDNNVAYQGFTLLLFLLLVAITLFPFEWLGEQWPPLGKALLEGFNTDDERAVAHILLFGTLGLLSLATFPGLRREPLLYIAALFAVAVGQETFQFVFKDRDLAFDDFRDLAIDTAAFVTVYALVRLWWRITRKRR